MIKSLFSISVILLLSAGIGPISSAMPAVTLNERTGEHLEEEILQKILRLRFQEADSLLELLQHRYPAGPAYFYLDNYLEFLDALILGEMDGYEQYMANSMMRIDSLRAIGPDDAVSFIYISTIHLQSAILSAYHGGSLAAARNFFLAHYALRKFEEAEDMHVLALRNRGLLTLGIASVPEEFKWVLNIAGMKGEVEEGIRQLDRYQNSAAGILYTESCLVNKIAGIMMSHGGQKKVIGADCMKDSLTLPRYLGALDCLSGGRSGEVVQQLGSYQQAQGERQLAHLDLLLGEAMLNGLDEDADIPLKRFLKNHRGRHYRQYAWHRLSWHFLIQGDSMQYAEARKRVFDPGDAWLDADRQALAEAGDVLTPNILLLKSRLLFDGGYYEEALLQLQKVQAPELDHTRDSVEYMYRMARICDRLGDRECAVTFYRRTMDSGTGDRWYFAPNAALHLGFLAEEEGELALAGEYYRKCLKINRSSYRRSIASKARQGIRRLGQ